MVKELFVDTNVLLKIFLSEEDFESVLQVISRIEDKEIVGYLSTVSVSEIVTIFGRRREYVDLDNILTWLSKTFEIVPVSTEIAVLSGHLKSRYASAKSPLSFADSIIAACCILYDISLITFDSEFEKIKELKISSLNDILE